MNPDILATLTSPPVMIALMVAAGVTLVLMMLMGRGQDKPDPLAKLKAEQRLGHSGARSQLTRKSALEDTALNKRLEKYKTFLEPTDSAQMGEARLKMVQAGYHGKNAVRDFHAAKLILGMGGLLIGLAYILLLPVARRHRFTVADDQIIFAHRLCPIACLSIGIPLVYHRHSILQINQNQERNRNAAVEFAGEQNRKPGRAHLLPAGRHDPVR